MNNVKTLNDLNNPKDNKQMKRYNFVEPPNYNSNIQNTSLSINDSEFNSDNSRNNVCKYIYALFPKFKLISFTFMFFIIYLLYYITEICFYYNKINKVKEQYSKSNYDLTIDNNICKGIWNCVLYQLGASYTPSIINNYQFFRLLTAIFMHGDYKHLLGNCISLFFSGFYLEHLMNRNKFFLFFIICGVYSNLFSSIFEINAISVGASGAIFANYGFLLVYYIFNYPIIEERLRKFYIYYLIIFVFNFIVSFQTYKDNNIGIFAHLGGLVLGMIISFYMIDLQENRLFLNEILINKLKLCQKILIIVIILLFPILCIYMMKLEVKPNYFNKYCL